MTAEYILRRVLAALGALDEVAMVDLRHRTRAIEQWARDEMESLGTGEGENRVVEVRLWEGTENEG